MSSQQRLPLVLPMLLVLALLGGCGERIETYPVWGTVTLSSGEPLVGGTVSMVSLDNSISATGRTESSSSDRFNSSRGIPGIVQHYVSYNAGQS